MRRRPSGYWSAQVSGLHHCPDCGVELDGDDPNERCDECAPSGYVSAQVIDLAARRAERAA